MDEKYQTACDKGNNLTYKRIKLVGTCKHRFKYKLVNSDLKG